MNDTNPSKPNDEDTPDAFEEAWIDTLAKHDPELSATRDAFVASVLDRHRAEQARPAVAGRIGSAWLAYAAAAVIAIAGVVGWFVLQGDPQSPTPNDFAQQPGSTAIGQAPQPGVADAVVPANAKPIPLGRLIAQTRSTVTAPASGLTAVVRDTPDQLQVRRLLDLFDNPMPDLKELLAPLDTTEDAQQSRA